ncbi:winged helix-turn-helix domain-containing protein [Candidatus Spongiihabitans sp.]|uniref:winged helix-turn-helix domain-containing protein n=1 Tax=Candidatus Spongiihabitans sp. TaxID=3101308 RepID=UPI003C6F7E0E
MKNSNSLSVGEARKLVLQSQRVLTAENTGNAIDATLGAIEHLGYVQIDTISVIQRAHHHTLWNRNPRYNNNHLDLLVQQGKVFEYWSHAAAYLPMQDYRFYLPDMAAIAKGRKLWYECDPKLKRQVLNRIVGEGPVQARDFERKETGKLAMWERKPAKYALEQLFMEGKLMVAKRHSFQKVYDLTSRVLPEAVDTAMPSTSKWHRFLIRRYLEANGLGQAGEISYLRKGIKEGVQVELDNMLEQGELIRININNNCYNDRYYVFPQMLELLSKPLSRARLKILSPFDNFVIQRKRISQFFGFDYQIECYVPEAKRKYGYFCLPIVWNAALAARMDCKADRKTGSLIIRNLVLEPTVNQFDEFTNALAKELRNFMLFNDCTQLVVNAVSDKSVKQSLIAKFT